MQPRGEPISDPAVFDAAAARLFESLLAAPRHDSFPQTLSAALATALALFDSEPDLAETLLDCDFSSPALIDVRAGWWRTFAHLLRSAAACDPGCRQAPFFIEPTLIAGADWTLARARHERRLGSAELRDRLLEYLLVYYLEPEELGPALSSLQPVPSALS